MEDYMQKKDLDEGFNFVYVMTIFIGGNTNKIGFIYFYNLKGQQYLTFRLHCISFLHVYGIKRLNMYKKEIQNSQSDKYF